MRVFRILLPVPDIEAAAKFYGALFQSPGERVSPGRHYFKSGDVVVACYSPASDSDGKPLPPLKTETYFAVPNLEETFERATRAGAKPSSEVNEAHFGHLGRIEKRPWGERSFYVSDPFGNPLCFVDERTLFTGRR
jgi:catechol 2,3-dioxygenase-like lactoylglutathione lyase family enzyme